MRTSRRSISHDISEGSQLIIHKLLMNINDIDLEFNIIIFNVKKLSIVLY